MTNHQSEKKLDLIINLLETLPQRMCNEFEKREEIRKTIRLKELTAEMEFLREHNSQINKMMYGVDPKMEIIPDDPKDAEIAKQLTAVLNYTLQNPIEDSFKE